MIVKLLTEHNLEFLSLKGGCRGLSESTHVKMPHCWKSHALAHIIVLSYPVFHCLPIDIKLTTVNRQKVLTYKQNSKIGILLHVNNKSADQPVHSSSLDTNLVIPSLQRIRSEIATCFFLTFGYWKPV